MKSFGNWDTQDLRLTFGLDDTDTSLLLTEWADYQADISEFEKKEINELRKDLAALHEAWNEDELKMNFIAPLLRLVHYGAEKRYKAFFQRSLSCKIADIEMSGIVDMVIASGWEKPSTPYFFLHEYKQEQAGKGDARGQLLAAMLTAQALNQNEKAIFGVYLVGANWRFVVLENKTYSIKRFDATKEEELLCIFSMLQWIKKYIETDLGLT
ncbi:MAG: hypothetical protein ACKVTZ_20350 [Bacteroidia bacterium]